MTRTVNNLDSRLETMLKRAIRESLTSSSLLREKDDDVTADDIFADADADEDDNEKAEEAEGDDIFADVDDDADSEGSTGADDDAGDAEEASDASPQPQEKDNKGGPRVPHAAQREKPAPDIDDMSLELIVAKLNAIRSGTSLKDKEVKKNIEEWYDSMNSTQRLALFAFLEGLAEIISLGRDGEIARSPDDPDINVNMKHVDRADNIDTPAAGSQTTRVGKRSSEEYGGAPGDAPQANTAQATRVYNGAESDDAPVLIVRR